MAIVENGQGLGASGFMQEGGLVKLYEVGVPRDTEGGDDTEDEDEVRVNRFKQACIIIVLPFNLAVLLMLCYVAT